MSDSQSVLNSENQIIATESSSVITKVSAWLCDVPVERARSDAMQSFVKQETIFVELETKDGVAGLGYSYTIGTGGGAVLDLVRSVFLNKLPGMDVNRPELVWSALYTSNRATAVGAITALALAAVDTAVWDARCRSAGLPLWAMAGGSKSRIPLYDTEGGWLHHNRDELVNGALAAKARNFGGIKIKVGMERARQDVERIEAVRDAVGSDVDVMVDANQAFTAAEAVRRASMFGHLDIFWFEEPMPADDVAGHLRLAQRSSIPVAVGESMYSLGHFRQYLEVGAAEIIQVDVARIGGITPWLKAAHLAEAFNVKVAPHFLMELHLSLTCAIANSLYLEYIPQLTRVTEVEMRVEDGYALAPTEPGLGIKWDRTELKKLVVA